MWAPRYAVSCEAGCPGDAIISGVNGKDPDVARTGHIVIGAARNIGIASQPSACNLLLSRSGMGVCAAF
jgi:hypothetical protein